MRALLLLTLFAIAGCKPAAAPDQAVKTETRPKMAKGGPPPLPPYQMRAELHGGDRLAATSSGEALFTNRCGSCHLAGGMGSNLLTKQMLAANRPPSDGLLANRTDMTPDYVKQVVRQGKMAMPRLTKVDVTDAELEAIAAYLGKAK
jgi:cytochrome c5